MSSYTSSSLVRNMCRISSKPSQFSISVEAGLLPSYLKSLQTETNDATVTSLASLPPTHSNATVESIENSTLNLRCTVSANNCDRGRLPASTRVYQTVVVEPFHTPSISLIFRAMKPSDVDSRISLVTLPSECSYMSHSGNHAMSKRERDENDDICTTRYIYETPPPSPKTRLSDPPTAPKFQRTLLDLAQHENLVAPNDLFLPLILT